VKGGLSRLNLRLQCPQEGQEIGIASQIALNSSYCKFALKVVYNGLDGTWSQLPNGPNVYLGGSRIVLRLVDVASGDQTGDQRVAHK
jgi:hypothetical protein